MKLTHILSAATLATSMLAAPAAHASLIGDTVTMQLHRYSDQDLTGVVGTDSFTMVFGGSNTRFDPTFTNTSISLGFAVDSPAWAYSFSSGHYVMFSGLDSPGQEITSVSLFEDVNDSRLSSAGLTWTASSLKLDLSDVLLRGGETVRFDITFGPAANGVPEPSTLALLGAAALALAFGRRRNQPTTASAGQPQNDH